MRVAHSGATFDYHGTKHLRNARKVLAVLAHLSREQPEYRPSLRELMELTGMSSAGVRAALDTLRDDYGYIEQASINGTHANRTIRLTDTAL